MSSNYTYIIEARSDNKIQKKSLLLLFEWTHQSAEQVMHSKFVDPRDPQRLQGID